MLEFRIVEDGLGVHIDEYMHSFISTTHRHSVKPLDNKKFRDEWYKKHHQHKIDELFEKGYKNRFYVSGDSSVRGNGVHSEDELS